MRAAQITAAAALLLTLVQVGKMITGEQPLHSGAQQSLLWRSRRERKDGDVIDQTLTSLSNRPISGASRSAGEGGRSDQRACPRRANGAEEESGRQNRIRSPPFAATNDRQEGDRPDSPVASGAGKIESPAVPAPVAPADSRKLIRNAQLDLQVANYEAAVQRLTTFANEEKGFVATQNSAKLPNGKAAGNGRGQSRTGEPRSLPAKGARTRRIEEPDARDRRCHESLFRYRRPPAQCEADGRTPSRNAE